MSNLKAGRAFSRNRAHRKAMMINLATAMIMSDGHIRTTVPKAKELRRMLERLVTKSRTNTLAVRRLLLSRLNNNNDAVNKLLNDLGPRFATRPGGYLRVLKDGYRAGDNAPMAYVLWSDQGVDAE